MKKIIWFVLLFAVVGFIIHAFAEEPGSVSDPVVTKSFLEEAYGWRVTTLAPGEKMTLDIGNETILRSGRAVIVGTKSGGLADLTVGQDLPDSVIIPANHYLISAASDGRGVKAIGTSVFLTRGLVR